MDEKYVEQTLEEWTQRFRLLSISVRASDGHSFFRAAAPEKALNIYSVSKIFTSLACLRAVKEGLFAPDDTVFDLLRDSFAHSPAGTVGSPFPRSEEELLSGHTLSELPSPFRRCTLRHLLSMQAGQKAALFARERREKAGKNWFWSALNEPFLAAPGEKRIYSNASYHIASVLLTLCSGRLPEEHLEDVFSFLCEGRPYFWSKDPLGFTFGASELFLDPRSFARLGDVLRTQEEHLFPLDLWNTISLPSNNGNTGTQTREHLLRPLSDRLQHDDFFFGFWRESDTVLSARGSKGQLIFFEPGGARVLCVQAQCENESEWTNELRRFFALL